MARGRGTIINISTDFWDITGVPVAHLPSGIVMKAEEMVDAALAGFDQGEFISIPSLPDAQRTLVRVCPDGGCADIPTATDTSAKA